MINKIVISDNDIKYKLNKNIKYKLLSSDDDIIKVISLDILNSDKLKIEYNIKEELKINLVFNILDSVSLNLIDEKKGINIKSKYHYILNSDSYLLVNKINDTKNIKEFDLVELNGINSKADYVLKTVSTTKETYDVYVNHNSKDTISNVITSGINIENGSILMNITGDVPKGCTGTIVNQINRIINFTNNKCQINPNLLIDEMDSSANHSAHVSKFRDEDLFYLESRGINKNEAFKLLIKGFLMDNILEEEKEYIVSLINKYWG